VSKVPIAAEKAGAAALALRAVAVSKAFPGVLALAGVNFDLRRGEVHGLVGANGAGKSTFIRILTRAEMLDEGAIELPLADAPKGYESDRGGQIASIYQELTVIPEMTVLSNAFIGNMPARAGIANRAEMLRRFEEISSSIGISLPPKARAGRLSIADQQLIEILRAILSRKQIIIMDEPTAPLGPKECEKLYELIGRLRSEGVSIIYVSHNLDEVLRLCDRISVMREGRLIATRLSSEWTKETLVGAMLGDVKIVPGRKAAAAIREELLSVQGLSAPGRVHDMSFVLRQGEILGIAGLVGSGRTEVLRALAGADAGAKGRIILNGRTRPLPASVREAIGLGIVMAPEDRKGQGLVLKQSGRTNLILPDMNSDAKAAVINRRRRHERALRLARAMGFDAARLDAPALNLSGGNQQKLVLGKWLNRNPQILLLDEPTRGIDLGSKQEIFRTIRILGDQGMGVMLVSSDLEEVIEHSDRVLVMAGGRALAILDAAEATLEAILGRIFAVEERTGTREDQQ
jgi:ABC-type sugar transport system ATPase subunit